MFETVISILVISLILAGVIYAGLQLKLRYRRNPGGSRMSGDGPFAEDYGAVAARVVAVAADTVLTRARNAVELPTGVEVGVSDRDYPSVRAQHSGLEAAVNERLRMSGVPTAGVRLLLREVPAVRRGEAIVISASLERATVVLGAEARTARLTALKSDVPRRAWLIVNGTRQRVAERAVVGRLQSCDIRLTSRHASGRHATIAWNASGWHVTDHSKNGTWVQGGRVGRDTTARLADGAVVRFADLDCVFVVT
ncbi:FHA domain-containing protein [Microbacterium sp. NPDC086615]|uniref:FHA domain-containing protein n=1 Tax=Microbacterium sp. NPDC086615 TaxID=3154865 RepID=UPI0034375CA9